MPRCTLEDCFQEVDNGVCIQCHLQKRVPGGTLEQTSWIPREFAVQGATLKLRDQTGAWVDGWKVVCTYAVDRGRDLGTVVDACESFMDYSQGEKRRWRSVPA
jgi:hypothetical protein